MVKKIKVLLGLLIFMGPIFIVGCNKSENNENTIGPE